MWFNDSDVYKWMEAVAWSLATHPDPELDALLDGVIADVAAAQRPDGYLNTYFALNKGETPWADLQKMHELYCAGHLIQAAVAHHRATGKRSLLDVAVRCADNLAATFGPVRSGTDGHPEVEMALVELARDTGDGRYLRLAQYFIDQRGQKESTLGGHEYLQDHAPVRDQTEVVGHAVRALYLYCGVADLYLETGEEALWQALQTLWHNFQQQKVYITGGAGARHEGESFGAGYELPNERAYSETCAAISHLMWAWRMLLATGDAAYTDALEVALYNGMLSGMALNGDEYFYVNPLADRGAHRRQHWFGCACCPPNLARLLASLPSYFYSTSSEGLWVHLYADGEVSTTLPGMAAIALSQRTSYPWDGEIEITVSIDAPASFSLFLRVPAWASGVAARVNGEPAGTPAVPGTYLELRRRWENGDIVRLSLPMAVRLVSSHPHVTNNLGRVAVIRGPLVYCIEAADNPGLDVWDAVLPDEIDWTTSWQPDLLGGVQLLVADALVARESTADLPLYRPYGSAEPEYRRVRLTAVPYCVWANREPGPMQVWIPIRPRSSR